jgi:hypothetical protein
MRSCVACFTPSSAVIFMREFLKPVAAVRPRPADPSMARYVRSYLIMRTVVGALGYRKRKGMIEPVFANTKFDRGIDRFQRRRPLCRALGMATHHRHAQPAEASHTPAGRSQPPDGRHRGSSGHQATRTTDRPRLLEPRHRRSTRSSPLQPANPCPKTPRRPLRDSHRRRRRSVERRRQRHTLPQGRRIRAAACAGTRGRGRSALADRAGDRRDAAPGRSSSDAWICDRQTCAAGCASLISKSAGRRHRPSARRASRSRSAV